MSDAKKAADQKIAASALHTEDLDVIDEEVDKPDDNVADDPHQTVTTVATTVAPSASPSVASLATSSPSSTVSSTSNSAKIEEKVISKLNTVMSQLPPKQAVAVSKVSTDKLEEEKPKISEPEPIKVSAPVPPPVPVQTSSLRRVSEPFKDTESPFLTQRRTDDQGNIVTDSTNSVSGK